MTTTIDPPRMRTLVTDGLPDAPMVAPRVQRGFLEAPEVRRVADALIRAHGDTMGFLASLSIDYLWRAKGGLAKSQVRLGEVQILAGLAAHYGAADVVLWLAADHLREQRLTNWQFEALIFSLLCRVQQDPDKGTLILVGPEFSGSFAELREYGAWNEGLMVARKQFNQCQYSFFDDLADDLADAARDLLRDDAGYRVTTRAGRGAE